MTGAGRTILFLGADAAYLYAFRGALMRAFQSRGYRVVAVAAVIGDFEATVFGDMGVTFRSWPLKKAALDPVADIGPVVSLWTILRQERPDVLFAHTIKPVIYGLMLARLAGVPRRTAMIPGLGYAFTEGGGWKRRIVRAVARIGYRFALSAAHRVIFQNADDRDALRLQGALPPGIPTGLVNGSGVDMDRFVPAPWPDGPPTFLMVARLLRDKGVYEYVEAARIVRGAVPDARFVLVGAADSNPAAVGQDEVDGWVAEGLIEARGHVADPRAAYAACHVFVLPSYREGTPRTNLEAMAMARAIITTDAPGCRETVIDGHSGRLVAVRDHQALAEAMTSLARDPDRARQMGQAGLAMCAERFDLHEVARATMALIVEDDAPAGEP